MIEGWNIQHITATFKMSSKCTTSSSIFVNFNIFKSLKSLIVITSFVICLLPGQVISSRGDRDYTFHNCVTKCSEKECNGEEYRNQPIYLRYLQWDCDGECKYKCMWVTVDMFMKHNLPVPQFFGKWPFVRVLGMQEPASVVFSLMNLVVHICGASRLRNSVPKDAPLLWLWYIFALISINGWIWSIVFHTRDFPITELMDYFSAFSMNAFSFFACFVRLFEKWFCFPVLTMGILILLFCGYHMHYLTFVHFDYGYNMKANIAMGVLNASCWLIWSGLNRKTHQHVWKCSLFVVLAVASLVLEVFDFSPVLWLIDAHALWHLSTAPIVLIWYSFLVDDTNFLFDKQQGKMKLM